MAKGNSYGRVLTTAAVSPDIPESGLLADCINEDLKRLGRQLSIRILGGKFEFSVGHGKFKFPSFYAEIASSGRIPIVSFDIGRIIAVHLKKYHA